MARNVRTSRRILAPDLGDLFTFHPGIHVGRVRRSGPGRRIVTVMRQTARYYGYLTALEGDAQGPWILAFDCTDANWFDDVVVNRLPTHYRVDRLERIIGNRDYWTAWDAAIASRVVMRRMYENYRNIAGSPDNPAPLATYLVHLTSTDAAAAFVSPPGQAPTLREGLWYGLELSRCGPGIVPSPDVGMLQLADPVTDALAAPAAWRPVRIHHLRTSPLPPPPPGPFQTGPLFRSQAVLQAFHFARGD